MNKLISTLFLIFLLSANVFAYDERYVEEQFDLGEGTHLSSYTKYRDGGTELFKIEDNWGNVLELYIDGRIDSKTIGSLYVDDYPAYESKRIEKASRPEEKLLYMLRDIYLYEKIDLDDESMTVIAIKAALKALLIEKGLLTDAEEDGIVPIAIKADKALDEKEAFQLAFNNCEVDRSLTTGTKGFAMYKYTIIGPDDEGCIVQSEFLENINPDYLDKTMQCIYDNSLEFYQSIRNTDRCEGELYDFIFDN